MKIGRSVLGRMIRFARRFHRDNSAAAAVQFALCVVPMSVAVFGMVDVSRASTAKLHLQDALDAAALAAARSTATTNEQLQAVGSQVLAADLAGARSTLTSSSFTMVDNKIVASATATMTPIISKLWLDGDMEMGASTEVVRASHDIEVSLVLDLTASMSGSKVADLKLAAKDLVDLVVKDVQTPYYTKVALVPYSMGINAGDYAASVRGTYTTGTCTTPGCEKYKFTNAEGNQKTHTISKCVTERTGTEAFTDAPPSDVLLGRNYPSSGNPCLSSVIVPLSSDRGSLKTSIENLQASGSTGGHIGVAWGWYMVSPRFGYLWPEASRPAAYGSKDLIKVVVLMTDGEYNSAYCKGVISKDSTSGSGAASDHINCNAPNGHAFDQAMTLCTNMKAAGVVVYTVGFQVVNDQRARDLVNGCASDAEHVYMPATGTALKTAFRTIAQDINAMRLAR